MGKNKRKSQSDDTPTPKKAKLNQGNPQIPDSNKKSPNIEPKNVAAKGKNKKKKNKNIALPVVKPDHQKKNLTNKFKKFTGTANLEEHEKKSSSEDESDYNVEKEIKPEKITKTMNEVNSGSDKDNEMSDCDDSDDEDAIQEEEVDNAVNENSENDEKKQKGAAKNKKINKSNEKKGPKVEHTEIKSIPRKMRYVLFIGNIPYTSTVQDIKNHFEKDCEIISVRIPKSKETNKPRGFCYLEVADNASYLKAMSRHHSSMNGRLINVLYTTGKKKNSVQDVKKQIKSKSFKLNALRKSGKLDGNMKHDNKRSVRRAKKRAFEKKNE